MRKLFLAAILASSFSAAIAQPMPDFQNEIPVWKNWLVYGNLGYDNQSNDNTANAQKSTTNSLSFTAGMGYRLNERFTVGLQGSTNYSTINTTSNDTSSKTSFNVKNSTDLWTIGAFVRHTHGGPSKMFYCFGQLNLSYVGLDAYPNQNYNISNFNNTTLDQIVNGYGFQINWFPGLGFRLHHGCTLELTTGGVGYTSIKQDHNNGTNAHWNINLMNQIKIGFTKQLNFYHEPKLKTIHESGDELHGRKFEKMSGGDDDDRKENKRVRDMDDE